jgi:hypothetical protein
MPKNQNIFFTSDIRARGSAFALADSTNSKDLLIPATDGTRIEALIITSTSATARVLFLQINDIVQGQVFQLGHITVPASAGQGSVNAVSGLNRGNLPWLQIDANGNPYLNLNNNMRLSARLSTALTGSEQVTVTVLGADYTA